MEILDMLRTFDIVYLGTPYSKYKDLNEAANRAAKMSAILRNHGINVYSPIVHGHALCATGLIDPMAHGYWLKANVAMMRKSDAFIIGTLPEWHSSKGLMIEYQHFRDTTVPIFKVSEDCTEIELLCKERIVFFYVE